MKVTPQHHRQVHGLTALTDALDKQQTDTLERLLDVIYREGRSAGYREGNPNYDED
jgi:hypothetical protein